MPEKTIRKYYDDIFRYCYHHVGDKAAAEDLCQDTFLSFIEHFQEYRQQGKAKNYLYTIACNKCKDYFKKHKPILLEDYPEQADESEFEQNVVIRQMLGELPADLREAVVLRFFQNLKYKDIAEILNISTSLAKYKVKKALEQLADMEGGECHDRTHNIKAHSSV
ncbi:MAG: RNA polymerase sigma factor [Acetatifactor sp.]|nr:RNA polymerase sigma factor [Acetatifactor sp.]